MSADKTEGTESDTIEQSSSYGSAGPQGKTPTPNTQHGVQDVEAVTLSWSKGTLIAVFIKYVSHFFCHFCGDQSWSNNLFL
jgi:hypothetical protein